VGWLPKGNGLADDVWRARHRALVILLWVHVGLLFAYGLATHHGSLHSGLDTLGVVLCAMLAASERVPRSARAAVAAVGLVTCSAVLVHLSGGLTEMHFHFFVVVGIMSLYQDWLPYLCAIGFVILHHAVLGLIAPRLVYDHAEAVAHPVTWALIHGGFVLAASAGSLISWRLNEEQALHDSLTRLPNRRLFQDRVEHALARTYRRPEGVGVLFIDLDGFKYVNDTLGHAAGDQLLDAVAGRLRSALRAGDTAARLGGDEFAVLVEDITSPGDAARAAERVLDALSHPFQLRGKTVSVSASIGIAMAEHDDQSTEDLLRNADLAMYAVKGTGRGRSEFFAPEMHREVLARAEVERELRVAIDTRQLSLQYQPVVDLRTERIIGVEALLRWDHPVHGRLAPATFLPIAEDTGLIVDIGEYVLDEACRQARRCRVERPDLAISMAVNLSSKQVVHADLLLHVERALSTNGVAAADLILELTESVMLEDSPAVRDRLAGLVAMGIRLAIDDFGTGYSSLSYLQRFPFDLLKIDKRFVDGIAGDPTQAALGRAIVSLADALGLDTIAEGIEQTEQIELLTSLGCRFGQGFLFARPMSGDDLVALLALEPAGGPHDPFEVDADAVNV